MKRRIVLWPGLLNANRHRRRRVGVRAAVLGIRVCIVLLLAEGILQSGAWFVARRGIGARHQGVDDGRPVVVFLGDSHIYGLHVEASETLPAQAESLSRAGGCAGFRAVNLGVMALPSWEVMSRSGETLAHMHPLAVVVRVGFNNWVLGQVRSRAWYERLRIVKLADTLHHPGSILRFKRRTREGATTSFEAQRVAPRADTPSMLRHLSADLGCIAAQARAAGAEVFFLSYFDEVEFPEGFVEINGTIEEAARDAGACFVDCASLGRQALAIGPREKLTYYDCHNTSLAYALEARLLLNRFNITGALGCVRPEDPIAYLLAHRERFGQTWRPSQARTVRLNP